MYLSGAQAFCLHEKTEVIVICKDENLMLAAFQVVAPSLEFFNECKKLTVESLVFSPCRNHFPRKERY